MPSVSFGAAYCAQKWRRSRETVAANFARKGRRVVKISRILSELIAVQHSLPSWDSEAFDWCAARNLVERVPVGAPSDNEADALTSVGKCYLVFVEDYATKLLKENHERGLLRTPNNNGTNDHTNEQKRHSAEDKAKQDKKNKDHANRYGRGTRNE